MARYRGPKLRIVRRLKGQLPGLTQKTSSKEYSPGQHGKLKKKNTTEYGLRLEEKQKLRYNYGITESKLFSYVKEARRQKGVTGIVLLQLLEMRLDTICFNLGFAPTMANSRQLVNHGHIAVNGNIVSIPSFQCKINDIITVKEKNISINLIKNNLMKKKRAEIPSHLKFNNENLEGSVLNYCDRKDLLLALDELLIVEYYSRR